MWTSWCSVRLVWDDTLLLAAFCSSSLMSSIGCKSHRPISTERTRKRHKLRKLTNEPIVILSWRKYSRFLFLFVRFCMTTCDDYNLKSYHVQRKFVKIVCYGRRQRCHVVNKVAVPRSKLKRRKSTTCVFIFSVKQSPFSTWKSNRPINPSTSKDRKEILFLFYYLYGALAEKETRNDDWTENRIMQFV